MTLIRNIGILLIILTLSSVVHSQVAPGYVIKPNDNIKTYVFANPDLNISTNVPPDGIINFPLVGEINVGGITTEQLTTLLEEKLSHYLIEPKVSVFVTAYNPLKVYILGAVRNPGALDYKPGQRLTDYLTEAGGFDMEANLKKCYVYSNVKDAEVRIYDLEELLENSKTELDIELEPYCTVYVKRKSGFMFSEWRDVADALSIIVGLSTLYFVISSR